MIEFTVTNPNSTDAAMLRAIADVLDGTTRSKPAEAYGVSVVLTPAEADALRVAFKAPAAGVEAITRANAETIRAAFAVPPAVMGVPDGTHVGAIAAVDNPAAGAEVLTCANAAVADPASIFGAGAPPVPGVPPLPNVQSPIPPPLPPASSPISTQPLTDGASASPPPPPPPAPAPVNASAAAPTTSGALTDSAGMPWDDRIHAGTKAKIANGTWKKRRGVEDSVVAEVEAQLRKVMAIPAAAPVPAAAAGWPFPTDNPLAVDAPMAFGTLVTLITERINTQRLTADQVADAVKSVGLEQLSLLMARPDLVPKVWAAIQAVVP